jgi:hypothetical protein
MGKHEKQPVQIQLELPDYSRLYYEYMKKKDQETKQEETVIVIDI